MTKNSRPTARAGLRLALCSTVLGGALLFALPAPAQVMTPDTEQPSRTRGVSNNPYGYIQDNGDGGNYGSSDDAVSPDTASSDGGGDGGGSGFVGPADDDGDDGGSGFGQMYGLDGDTPDSLAGFVQDQDETSDARESAREKAIVKAALDKQRQIRDANIAQRERAQAMIKKAAKQAAGKNDDGSYYTQDGGDDGYYGQLDNSDDSAGGGGGLVGGGDDE
jgi:hypothetical protein